MRFMPFFVGLSVPAERLTQQSAARVKRRCHNTGMMCSVVDFTTVGHVEHNHFFARMVQRKVTNQLRREAQRDRMRFASEAAESGLPFSKPACQTGAWTTIEASRRRATTGVDAR